MGFGEQSAMPRRASSSARCIQYVSFSRVSNLAIGYRLQRKIFVKMPPRPRTVTLEQTPGAAFFQVQQIRLRLQPAGKACQLSRRANHAMARHNDGDRISSIGRAYRPHRLRIAQLPRQFSIAPGLAEGYGEQGMPYALLKRSASHIESHRECLALAGKILSKLTLGVPENRMSAVFHLFVQANAARLVVFPQNRYQSLVACHQLQSANRRVHRLVCQAHRILLLLTHDCSFVCRAASVRCPKMLCRIGAPWPPQLGAA